LTTESKVLSSFDLESLKILIRRTNMLTVASALWLYAI